MIGRHGPSASTRAVGRRRLLARRGLVSLLVSAISWQHVFAQAGSGAHDRPPGSEPRRPSAFDRSAPAVAAAQKGSAFLFVDPNTSVLTKEFALFHNSVPDPARGPGALRSLFHLVYQRSRGSQSAETAFGHAWSQDLLHWAVDTTAFSVDTTWWNTLHVWSPSIVRHGSRDYLFYTGVDAQGDQRIGYASTARLDTSNTQWDPARVMVWEARNTRWAVPDPPTYGGATQFRDAFVMKDPDDPARLLMFYEAHDSITFRSNQSGLVCGVARSLPGSVDAWEDLGFYPSTLRRTTQMEQLEGPHVFPVDGGSSGWRLMFSNGGSPAGEDGGTTIRFEDSAPGTSPSDTTRGNWSSPVVLMQYLNGDSTAWGWSGSEHLRAGGADYLAGFTAWSEITGVAIARMQWSGRDFTLGAPMVTAVDEYRAPGRDIRMRVADRAPGSTRVTFLFESPIQTEARLEVFDPAGRRIISLLDGTLSAGRSSREWDFSTARGGPVPSGVFLARLTFPGGARVAQIPVLR